MASSSLTSGGRTHVYISCGIKSLLGTPRFAMVSLDVSFASV